MEEKTINLSCYVLGTIEIGTYVSTTSNDEFSTTGNYADYMGIDSAERLFNIVKQYDWIDRNIVGKKPITASQYTLKMAKNDFDRLSKFRHNLEDYDFE
jgi:hypothetical protein